MFSHKAAHVYMSNGGDSGETRRSRLMVVEHALPDFLLSRTYDIDLEMEVALQEDILNGMWKTWAFGKCNKCTLPALDPSRTSYSSVAPDVPAFVT